MAPTCALVPVTVLTVSALSFQVLQGAQLIAVASSDPTATGVDGSPLQGSDIQVQYVQLAPVTDHTTAAQVGPASLCGQVFCRCEYGLGFSSSDVLLGGR